MPSLYHTLNIGAESLYATRQGVDTAGHNIANAQVEGYSRQRVNLHQRLPLNTRGLLIGNGAYVGSITRSHDKFIENQINKAHQGNGHAQARADSLKTLEVVFSPELQSSVADELTKFFNGLQDLSNFPDDFTVRTNVVESAKNLSGAFQRVDSELKQNRLAMNEKVFETSRQMTDRLQEIASLNVKIQTMEAGEGQVANDLRDERDKLLREVSRYMDISYYEDQHGMLLIRGPKEVTLVDRGHAAEVSVIRNSENDGFYDLTVTDWEQRHTRNITDGISTGAMKAYLQVRDETLPQLLQHNNELAYTLSESFNSVHRQGFGLKEYAEKTGRDFFRAPTSLEHAASEFGIDDSILNSNDAISVASSPLASGDNVIANMLVKLKDAKVLENGNTTMNEYYANYVGALGLDVVRADHMTEASDIVVTDLNKRREAVAGVSLDEEATNIMKWQSNFTASSKLITTVDEMLETVLSLKR